MDSLVERLKGLWGLLKFAGPILGLGGAGTTAIWRGPSVLEGFAHSHLIELAYNTSIETDVSSRWAWEIFDLPIGELAASPIMLLLFILAFVGSSCLLLYHLFSRRSRSIEGTFYAKYHNLLTVLIYVLLLLLVIMPTHIFVFFCALLVLLVFSSAHLYYYASDFVKGSKEERITYLVPAIVLVLIIMFLPATFGRSYFSPDVWCPSASKGTVTGNASEVVTVYLTDPAAGAGNVIVGFLSKRDGAKFSLSLTEQPTSGGAFDSINPTPPIPLNHLLTLTWSPGPASAKGEGGTEQEGKKGDVNVTNEGEADISAGYPMDQ